MSEDKSNVVHLPPKEHKTQEESLNEVSKVLAKHLVAIKGYFVEPAKITILIRFEDAGVNSIYLGDDTVQNAMKTLAMTSDQPIHKLTADKGIVLVEESSNAGQQTATTGAGLPTGGDGVGDTGVRQQAGQGAEEKGPGEKVPEEEPGKVAERLTVERVSMDTFPAHVVTMFGLPDWEHINLRKEQGEQLNPLELFIYSQEPAKDANKWRDSLKAVLTWAAGTPEEETAS